MAFAIIDIAGTQEKVEEGATLRVPLMPVKEGEKIKLDNVLLVSDGSKGTKVGSPYVSGASVEVKVLGDEKGDKIRVFTMKHRKRCRKTQGHRQKYTKVEVVKIKI